LPSANIGSGGAGSPGKYRSMTAGTGTGGGMAMGMGIDRKPIATRRRVVQSCSECRRRKIKCDKK
jgi:hypothetical protein